MTLQERVEAIALSKKIPFLVHFTRTENIPSIMQHGLIPVGIANGLGLAPRINDPLRLDGRLNGTSLSISFPNAQMFYRLRKENPDVSWAVLAISTCVLWSKDVFFCCHNAADKRVSKLAPDVLRQSDTFETLFHEIDGIESRAEQGIREFDPTDVQAEALVMEPIEPELIFAVFFNAKQTLDEFKPYLGTKKVKLHPGQKGFFANRTYHRKSGGR